MNERIRNLYIQAINDTKHHPADDINTQIAEKFAELIVKECAEWLKQPVNQTPSSRETMNIASNRLKEHFGVEE